MNRNKILSIFNKIRQTSLQFFIEFERKLNYVWSFHHSLIIPKNTSNDLHQCSNKAKKETYTSQKNCIILFLDKERHTTIRSVSFRIIGCFSPNKNQNYMPPTKSNKPFFNRISKHKDQQESTGQKYRMDQNILYENIYEGIHSGEHLFLN